MSLIMCSGAAEIFFLMKMLFGLDVFQGCGNPCAAPFLTREELIVLLFSLIRVH